VPWSYTPPNTIPPRPTYGEVVVAFRHFSTLGIRDEIDFEAANPTAHTLACLRFAGLVAETVARLATGSGGLPLAGRVSHPLDDKRSFMKSSHPPFPFDQQCLVALKRLSVLDLFNRLVGWIASRDASMQKIRRNAIVHD